MASDEYIWDLVLQEAAAGGVLDLEYLNDDRQLYSSSYGKATPTVPSIDHLFNDCLLDDLFSFDDVTPSYKPVGTETIVATGILPEAVGVEAGVFYTDSFILDNVSQDTSSATDMVDYSLPVPDQFTSYTLKPELVPASSPDHLQYVADYSQSFAPATTPVEESAVSHFENPATFSFPDFTPDMLSRLLASLSQVECDEEETTSSFCDESVYMLTEDSANCSEMDEDGAETDSESFNSEELASSRGGRSQGQASSKAGTRGADRKKRKMQQNRVAAYRYRQKKKAEQDASFAEREGLEKRNAALKSKVQQMTQEIAYLRGLMADMVKVRSAVRQ